MQGTDLGIAVAHGERLAFLFGDTMASDRSLVDTDTWATTRIDAFDPTAHAASRRMPTLRWEGTLAPPGLALPKMGVPTDAFSVDEDTYVFFATDFDERTQTYGTSALARTEGLAFDRLAVVSRDAPGDFAHVSVVVEDGIAFLFGTGTYRRSSVRLAQVPVERIADRRAWRRAPRPVVETIHGGELSVRKHPRWPLYLLAFNANDPARVPLYLAPSPEGPWREAGLLFDARDGYEQFIHAKESVAGYDDGLSQPDDEETSGGPYAPYFVPAWFHEEGDALGIVFTLSSWNPYQVHLVRTWLAPTTSEDRRPPARTRAPAPPPLVDRGGCEFVVGHSTARLAFTLGRGLGRALLLDARTGAVLRASRARLWRRRDVCWSLDALEGARVRLVLEARAASLRFV